MAEQKSNLDFSHIDNTNTNLENDVYNSTLPPSNGPQGVPNIQLKKKTYVPFWAEDPNVIFSPPYLFELFPSSNMTYAQKLNAISRLVLILSVIGFLYSRNIRLLLISAITLGAIYLLYKNEKTQENKNEKNKATLENFDSSPALLTLSSNNVDISKLNIRDTFDSTDSSNPFSNVLNSDFDLNPHKKPAPPAYNSIVNDNIVSQAKQLVVDANPDQPDIADKLFKDLGDQYMFEQSLRPFNSNPSTTIPNDQQAFSEFCYGSMISCKENNMFACARNLARHQNI
jgi:hypothetical protein